MKPSWDEAPEWANWLAKNCVGLWTFIELEPFANDAGGWSAIGHEKCKRSCVNHDNPDVVTLDWKESLERRP